MVKFNCKCGEGFRISENHLRSKENMKCPNCDLLLPREILEPLNTYADYYVKAMDAFCRAEKKANTNDPVLGKTQDWILAIE